MKMSTILKIQLAALGMALAAGMTGCGMQGSPQPPSLNLPVPVSDLSASRAGSQVTITCTMPLKNTDKLLLKGMIAARICRQESKCACEPIGSELAFAPGADGTFTETLPAAFVAGVPRPLSYFVELKNHNSRSAGLSNAAQVLAGDAPPPVVGLATEVRKQGVVLRWMPVADARPTAIRLHRKLLTPPPAKKSEGLLTPQAEPLERNLLVEPDSQATDRTLDKDIRFGQTYEYRAQRVARVTVDGSALELDGELSAPVRVEALDIFPPEVPADLAAVATMNDTASETAIDLSWQPVPDTDLAGYIVYRREGDTDWQRISSAQPLVPPAFHDTHILLGHSYHYAVSAVDQSGHESARSTATEETVPNP
jgi:hypothetical protein